MNQSTKRKQWWIALIGSGVTLSPIHNTFLTNLATNSKGEVVFFLPAFAFVLIIVGSGFFLLNNWDRVKEIGWGDKRITIPLFIIIAAIALSGINIDGVMGKVAPLGMGVSLFALYLAARVLGKDLFIPLAIGVAIASLGIVIAQIISPGNTTGGLVFEHNFDIATGYILLGAALFIHRWRWILASLAVVALLLLSGAPEAVFAIGVIFLVVLIRRDWSKKMLVPIGAIAIAVIVLFASGHAEKLFSYVVDSIQTNPVANYVSPEGESASMSTLGIRKQVILDAYHNFRPLGDGYNVTEFKISTVHNVPLILVQQMGYPGIIAALAWLWICIYCLIRTRWKYAWALVLILSVFDHFLWTQISPVWFALIGVSTASDITSDFIFRKDRLSEAPPRAPEFVLRETKAEGNLGTLSGDRN